ncbi:IS4 family transposase, partial [bacterium]|nr:IS4 family transposase [bacterium]
VFDKAYVDYDHLYDLLKREVNWVTRAKSDMAFRVKQRRIKKPQGQILRDNIIVLKSAESRTAYHGELRRVLALVEVKGKKAPMEFITNNLEWAASSVCDIYQSRWEIEVFFKQIKQNLKLCDFPGNNTNAVRWQVWMALLAYVLLRYLGYQSDWNHSFSRLCTVVRGVLWEKLALLKLLVSYGTAGGHFRMLGRPDQM